MAENSKIEWCDHTFNPWVGCEEISPACDHCYARAWAKRVGRPELWEGIRQRTTVGNWRKPLKWHAAVPDGQRQRVFCASLADVFDNKVPEHWRHDLWELIRATPRLDWLLLTKRIGNVKAMLPNDWGNSIYGYNNVWLGATVVTQEEADRDIPKLLAIPARVRFLSCEPLLESIDLHFACDPSLLDWIIVGGESGSKPRPMAQEWALELARVCDDCGVAFFMKQGSQANWTAYKDFSRFAPELQVRQWPSVTT